MAESKHTPTPWTLKIGAAGDLNIADAREGFHYIKLTSPWREDAWDGDEEAKANAAFIVRAVNAHDDLVAALKLAQQWLANSAPVTSIDGPKPLPVIAAALAKAEA